MEQTEPSTADRKPVPAAESGLPPAVPDAEGAGTGSARGGLARPLWWYFGGLIAFYVAGVAVFWPPEGEAPGTAVFLVLMFSPTVGALLARFVGGGRIQWGRLTWWILAGFVPTVAALGAYLAGAMAGWVTQESAVLAQALLAAPLSIFSASLSAVGEEIGWRGFLWPTLRARSGFWRTSLIVGVVWWFYHVPLVVLGWYGSVAGLPAFTVAIVGFVLFVGVLTERSRSIWPSVIAHGAWNALVATSFALTTDLGPIPAFTGSDALLGEFGWLAAVTTLVLGGLTAWWHQTHPPKAPQHVDRGPADLSPADPRHAV